MFPYPQEIWHFFRLHSWQTKSKTAWLRAWEVQKIKQEKEKQY